MEEQLAWIEEVVDYGHWLAMPVTHWLLLSYHIRDVKTRSKNIPKKHFRMALFKSLIQFHFIFAFTRLLFTIRYIPRDSLQKISWTWQLMHRRWRLYRPKQKAVVFLSNPKNYTTQYTCRANFHSCVLGWSSCSSPSNAPWLM